MYFIFKLKDSKRCKVKLKDFKRCTVLYIRIKRF